MNSNIASSNRWKQKTRERNTSWIGLFKSKFVLSLIYIKQLQSLKAFYMYVYKDIVVVEPVGYWKSAKYYMIQRKSQLGRLVIVIVVTPLNLYHGTVATFVWINMQNFRNFLPLYLFSSSNQFRIRTCSICCSCDLVPSVQQKEQKWSSL